MAAIGTTGLPFSIIPSKTRHALVVEAALEDSPHLPSYVNGVRFLKTASGEIVEVVITNATSSDAAAVREWYTPSSRPHYHDPKYSEWWPTMLSHPDAGCSFIKCMTRKTHELLGLAFIHERVLDSFDSKPTTILRGLRVAPWCSRETVEEPEIRGVGLTLVMAVLWGSVSLGTSGMGVNSSLGPQAEGFYARILGDEACQGSVFDARKYFICKDSHRLRLLKDDYKRFLDIAVEVGVDFALRTPVFIDTDPGVDDAQALLMALSCAHSHVVGIGCVHGNVEMSAVVSNLGKILSVCDQLDVPVHVGCERPLVGDVVRAAYFHGSDGLGQADSSAYSLPPSHTVRTSDEHAAMALIRASKEYEGDLVVVGLGPLTNIALALRLDPKLPSRLKKMVIMGGSSDGQGNTTAAAEFNFYCDPEAAAVVLREVGPDKLWIVPWETTVAHAVPWTTFDEITRGDGLTASFVRAITGFSRKFCMKEQWDWIACDPLAMAVALRPDCVVASEVHPAVVETMGTTARGMMIIDRRKSSHLPNAVPMTATIVTKIDVAIFLALMSEAYKDRRQGLESSRGGGPRGSERDRDVDRDRDRHEEEGPPSERHKSDGLTSQVRARSRSRSPSGPRESLS